MGIFRQFQNWVETGDPGPRGSYRERLAFMRLHLMRLIEWKREGWPEAATTECVMIPDHDRRTACVSSQVGCALACAFCATGRQGFVRNLSTSEIIDQIKFFKCRFCGDTVELSKGRSRASITHVVFMGMGEPLANYDNVRQAIDELNSPKGMGMGFHQVTLSTAGLIPQIRQIAGAGLQFQLAVSLHAADDELRNRLVPINRKYPLDQLISACKEYYLDGK